MQNSSEAQTDFPESFYGFRLMRNRLCGYAKALRAHGGPQRPQQGIQSPLRLCEAGRRDEREAESGALPAGKHRRDGGGHPLQQGQGEGPEHQRGQGLLCQHPGRGLRGDEARTPFRPSGPEMGQRDQSNPEQVCSRSAVCRRNTAPSGRSGRSSSPGSRRSSRPNRARCCPESHGVVGAGSFINQQGVISIEKV